MVKMKELQRQDREAVEEYVAMRMPFVTTRQYGAVCNIGNMGSESISHLRTHCPLVQRPQMPQALLPWCPQFTAYIAEACIPRR
jgi:hypothetical protein